MEQKQRTSAGPTLTHTALCVNIVNCHSDALTEDHANRHGLITWNSSPASFSFFHSSVRSQAMEH